MGIFDNVRHEMECPNCGRLVDDFQTKDDDCVLLNLEFWEVDNFYTFCTCGVWIEFNRDGEGDTIEAYKMTVRKRYSDG